MNSSYALQEILSNILNEGTLFCIMGLPFLHLNLLYFPFKSLRSLKLGIVPGPTTSPGSSQPLVYTIRSSVDVSNFSWNDKKTRQGKESPILTRTCLSPLSADGSAAGYVEYYDLLDLVLLTLQLAPNICLSSFLKDIVEKITLVQH